MDDSFEFELLEDLPKSLEELAVTSYYKNYQEINQILSEFRNLRDIKLYIIRGMPAAALPGSPDDRLILRLEKNRNTRL